MKCRLCGQPTVGPGKMCVDCVGALRRARNDSTAPDAAARGPQDANETPTSTTVVPGSSVTSAPRFASRRLVLWATGCLLVIAGVYFGEKLLDWQPAGVTAAVENSPPSVAASPLVGAPTSATPASGSNQPDAPQTTAGPATTATPRVTPMVSVRPVISRPPEGKIDPKTAKIQPAPSTPAMALSGKAVRTVPRSNDDPAPTEQDQSPVNIAQAASAPKAASADRDKVLANALTKCAEAGFLSGLICEQQARLQYCEGALDTDPQCSRPQREQR